MCGTIQVQFNKRICMVEKPYDAKMFLHSKQLFRVRAKGVEGDTIGVTPSGFAFCLNRLNELYELFRAISELI